MNNKGLLVLIGVWLSALTYLQFSPKPATIAEHLTETLRTFSQDQGIDLVLNWGLSGEGVLYGTDSRDITIEVLEALNDPK